MDDDLHKYAMRHIAKTGKRQHEHGETERDQDTEEVQRRCKRTLWSSASASSSSSSSMKVLWRDYKGGYTNDDVHTSIVLEAIVKPFLDNPAMQRTRYLRQLGAAWFVYTCCTHSRFEHSLGVGHLAYRLVKTIQAKQPMACRTVTNMDAVCLFLAGLLHDIGHGPFSHMYEDFLEKLLPQYLERYPDLQQHYKNCSNSTGAANAAGKRHWTHEEMSLQLVDVILEEYMGVCIDYDNLDNPLKQLRFDATAIDASSLRVAKEQHCGAATAAGFASAVGVSVPNEEMEEDGDDEDAGDNDIRNGYVLTSRDMIFVKECICGKPIPEVEAKLGKKGFHGRPQEYKQWLYDIVCNGHSGLDVDKIDYFARDERRAMRGSGEIDKVMIEDACIAWGVCNQPKCQRLHRFNKDNQRIHLMICLPEKRVKSVIDFFKKRADLHMYIYQHRTDVAYELMICDIFCLADPFFRLPVRPSSSSKAQLKCEYTSLPISQAMLDPLTYLRLNDSIIDLIYNASDPRLKPAQDLIDRLRRREGYKLAVDKKIHMDETRDTQLWNKSESEIKQEMINVRGQHHGVEALTVDDYIIVKIRINQGNKDQNPLQRVRFVPKKSECRLKKAVDRLPEAHVATMSDYKAHLVETFEEKSIRIYARDASKTDLILHVWEQYLEELSGEVEITPTMDGGGADGDYHAAIMLSQDDAEYYGDDNENDTDSNLFSPASLQQPGAGRCSDSTAKITPTRRQL